MSQTIQCPKCEHRFNPTVENRQHQREVLAQAICGFVIDSPKDWLTVADVAARFVYEDTPTIRTVLKELTELGLLTECRVHSTLTYADPNLPGPFDT